MTDNRDGNPNTAPLVRVDWEDICFADSWNEGDGSMLQCLESTTTGYLIYEDATRIVVAGSYNWRAQEWATVHALPKGAPEIKVIKEGT